MRSIINKSIILFTLTVLLTGISSFKSNVKEDVPLKKVKLALFLLPTVLHW